MIVTPEQIKIMASEEASSNEAAQKPAADPPSNETIAAALEEALQNARLLRVSSSIFLKEAKELLDSGRVRAQCPFLYPFKDSLPEIKLFLF